MPKLTVYYFGMYKESFHLMAREVEGPTEEDVAYELSGILENYAANKSILPFSHGMNLLIQSLVSQIGGSFGQQIEVSLPPKCPDHGSEMVVSKYTQKDATTTYYCQRKAGDKYCQCQADLMPNGSVSQRRGKAT